MARKNSVAPGRRAFGSVCQGFSPPVYGLIPHVHPSFVPKPPILASQQLGFSNMEAPLPVSVVFCAFCSLQRNRQTRCSGLRGLWPLPGRCSFFFYLSRQAIRARPPCRPGWRPPSRTPMPKARRRMEAPSPRSKGWTRGILPAELGAKEGRVHKGYSARRLTPYESTPVH